MKKQEEVSASLIIHKFRHGYSRLSRMNWNSVSGVHISVAGVLGIAAGFLFAASTTTMSIRRRNSSDSHKLKLCCFLPGLHNLGNNCFLNVVLQALASCLCFQNYLQSIIDHCESSFSVDQRLQSFPLTLSLAALLKDLCMVGDKRAVLSPRKVMVAMNLYIANFNLSTQQDAAEAFLHLLSSLREEFSESYVPTHGSLADVSDPISRIFNPVTKEECSEQKRWQQHYLGPLDGILGSVLTCQSCSSEIMMDFEFFHSLPLSPVLGSGRTIMYGCSVEDCLKQFTAVEQIENYHCDRCWHISAVKYLLSVGGSEVFSVGGSEAEIGKLKSCGGQDSCGCKELFHPEPLPWSNSISRTFKQLSIARHPKILCIHLQRASVNEFGEPCKLQGHISFPLILNMSPFMKSGVGVETWEEDMQRRQEKQKYQRSIPYAGRINMHIDTRIRNHIYGLIGENVYSEPLATQELGGTAFKLLDNSLVQTSQGDSRLDHMHMESDDKATVTSLSIPSSTHTYHLVSVVEHFGRAGSGHYTVYRRMRQVLDNEDPQPAIDHWFSISDSDVYSVSKKDVLAAEASLLFYERVSEG